MSDVWDKPGDLTQRAAAIDAKAQVVFGGADFSDERSFLMGFYGGIVRALQPLTRGELLGPRIEDYGYRLLEELVTQAEERLKADEEDM